MLALNVALMVTCLGDALFPDVGVAHTIDFTTSAGGHTWAYFDRMAEPALRFIHDGLLNESRRLL